MNRKMQIFQLVAILIGLGVATGLAAETPAGGERGKATGVESAVDQGIDREMKRMNEHGKAGGQRIGGTSRNPTPPAAEPEEHESALTKAGIAHAIRALQQQLTLLERAVAQKSPQGYAECFCACDAPPAAAELPGDSAFAADEEEADVPRLRPLIRSLQQQLWQLKGYVVDGSFGPFSECRCDCTRRFAEPDAPDGLNELRSGGKGRYGE
jgi:hypothetical protein